MAKSVVLAVCLTFLCLVTVSVAKKSHNITLVKVGKITTDDGWIGEPKAELIKIDKNTKLFNASLKLKQDINGDDVKIEIKIYQQSGGKYVKAPLDFPKQSLCQFFEDNDVLWPCVQEHSNIPKKCPIYKDLFWIKRLNPNDCNYGNSLPPNLPENYRGELYFWHGLKLLLKLEIYGKLRKNMYIK